MLSAEPASSSAEPGDFLGGRCRNASPMMGLGMGFWMCGEPLQKEESLPFFFFDFMFPNLPCTRPFCSTSSSRIRHCFEEHV